MLLTCNHKIHDNYNIIFESQSSGRLPPVAPVLTTRHGDWTTTRLKQKPNILKTIDKENEDPKVISIDIVNVMFR